MKETLPGIQGESVSPPTLEVIAITMIPIKRHVSIREMDNGYEVTLDAGMLHQELIFEDYRKLIKVLAEFLKDKVEGSAKEDKKE
jgi:hypothetical protein